MAVVEVSCIECGTNKVIKNGKSSIGKQRYRCKGDGCGKTFQLSYGYEACKKGIKEQIVDMALNGSGVRDTARVLSIAIGTVITTLKKSVQPCQSQYEEINGCDSK